MIYDINRTLILRSIHGMIYDIHRTLILRNIHDMIYDIHRTLILRSIHDMIYSVIQNDCRGTIVQWQFRNKFGKQLQHI